MSVWEVTLTVSTVSMFKTRIQVTGTIWSYTRAHLGPGLKFRLGTALQASTVCNWRVESHMTVGALNQAPVGLKIETITLNIYTVYMPKYKIWSYAPVFVCVCVCVCVCRVLPCIEEFSRKFHVWDIICSQRPLYCTLSLRRYRTLLATLVALDTYSVRARSSVHWFRRPT